MQAGGAPVELCEPLARLKSEHGPLREQMDAYAREAAEIGTNPNKTDWSGDIASLQIKVETFVRELDPHSEREEEILFPLMAKHVGRQMGPIAVMEHEHELAKQNLAKFTENARNLPGNVDADLAKEIVSYALQAHAVLTEHFMKEENVLFPMAEHMLNAEEKEQLARAWE
ncbi:hemerythrin domain-containing protein [Paenibacillus thalictri]|uniref:Hemerythrin domain-containing protein n=1 Tax=Paenibacillus thalictri TaxID=2527873 RepID=A0A4Q9DMC4_9BACL|nr:hemerythrin domain-containing protein [Paenibacillus thalictri]TBL76392.1 hemerythrin domain-containing protein [Paenibacillus thalictri]